MLKRADQPIRIDRRADAFEQLAARRAPRLPVATAASGAAALGARAMFSATVRSRKERRLLVDGGDAERARGVRIDVRHGLAADRQRPGVGR